MFQSLIVEPTVAEVCYGADSPWNILWEILLQALNFEGHCQSGKPLTQIFASVKCLTRLLERANLVLKKGAKIRICTGFQTQKLGLWVQLCAERLPSVHEALGLIPAPETTQRK